MTELLAGNKAVLALAAEEYLAIHAMCDQVGAPRERHGEKLSVSQRVGLVLRGVRYREVSL